MSLRLSSFFEFFFVSWFLRTFFLLFELLILFPFSVGTWNRLFSCRRLPDRDFFSVCLVHYYYCPGILYSAFYS